MLTKAILKVWGWRDQVRIVTSKHWRSHGAVLVVVVWM